MAKRPTPNTEDNGRRGGRVDPLIAALLGHLPPAHTVWPPPERQKWIEMLADALGVIYKDAPPPSKPGASGGQSAPGNVRTP